MKRAHSELGGSTDPFETNKKAHVEMSPVVEAVAPSRQQLIETMRAMQAHIETLNEQLQSERQLAYQALHDQHKMFLEWQHAIERAYGGVGTSLKAIK